MKKAIFYVAAMAVIVAANVFVVKMENPTSAGDFTLRAQAHEIEVGPICRGRAGGCSGEQMPNHN